KNRTSPGVNTTTPGVGKLGLAMIIMPGAIVVIGIIAAVIYCRHCRR
ncbi:hypothetical protein scyTo_0024320, partial [Scyliorhinus torazame]|nr:hypothetical protein [Scyliorhinus torazame]